MWGEIELLNLKFYENNLSLHVKFKEGKYKEYQWKHRIFVKIQSKEIIMNMAGKKQL